MPNSDSIYPISVVMQMTNLSARQIRYYESQGLIKPARSKGNQRLYTGLDVENLILIKNLLEKGLNLDGIRAVLNGSKSPDGIVNQTPSSNSSQVIFNPQHPAAGPKLTSLYPVNNQEALNNWLQHKRK